jgi:Hint module
MPLVPTQLMASEGRYCILRTDVDQTQLTTQPPPSTAAPQTIVATVPKPTIVGTTAAGASATTSFIGQNSGTLSVSTTTDPRPGMTVVAGSSDRNGSGNASCFPGDATTQLADGRLVRMDALEVGDNVRVAGGAYSTVFGFTHRDAGVRAEFIHMATERGERVQATAGHYLRVNGVLVAAGAVRIGDALENADGLRTRVTHIRKAFGLGLYNPQTLDGEIVVDGILASTYTTAVEPAMAHAWLTPVRAVYRVFGMHCTAFDDGAESLTRLLPKGHGIVA